jgi:hypothetical protein
MGISFSPFDFHLSNGVFPISFAMKFQRRHWLEDFAWRVERVTQKFRLSSVSFLSVCYNTDLGTNCLIRRVINSYSFQNFRNNILNLIVR